MDIRTQTLPHPNTGLNLRSLFLIPVIGLLAVATTGCAGNPSQESAQRDIVDTAVAAGEFDTLVTAVKAAGLVETLKGEGPLTVFAPTDEAFAKIPQDRLQALLEDKQALTKVLTYHVVPGRVTADEVVTMQSAQTVEGGSIRINGDGMGVTVNDARVVKTDILASNGVIHVIDEVILPE